MDPMGNNAVFFWNHFTQVFQTVLQQKMNGTMHTPHQKKKTLHLLEAPNPILGADLGFFFGRGRCFSEKGGVVGNPKEFQTGRLGTI